MPAVHLIRHGQASFGASNYDVLSATGHEQASLVAQELRRRDVRPVLLRSGSLQRQRDTAVACLPLLAAARVPGQAVPGQTVPGQTIPGEASTGAGGADGDERGLIGIDERWNEYDHLALLRSRRAATLWAMSGAKGRDRSRSVQKVLDAALLDWATTGEPDPSGQTFADFAGAGVAALEDVLQLAGSGGTAVVFTSGGVIAAVCARVLGVGAEGFVALNRVTVNTGITTFVRGRSGTSLLSFNEHSHLAGHPDLLTYR